MEAEGEMGEGTRRPAWGNLSEDAATGLGDCCGLDNVPPNDMLKS
jgi:hypothetical protein